MNLLQRIEIQPSYILYTQSFKESSLLLEVFCCDYGRVSLVARGARRGKSRKSFSRFQGLLEPFVPLLLSWRGRGDLFNLTQAESYRYNPMVVGRSLLGGWYINELLVRTLKHWDAYTQLFSHYQTALYGLSYNLPFSLRQFEKNLLTALGMMPTLGYETQTEIPVHAKDYYFVCPINGVFRAKKADSMLPNCFLGEILLAIHQDNWKQKTVYWPPIKRLFRILLDALLEGRPLRSRDLL